MNCKYPVGLEFLKSSFRIDQKIAVLQRTLASKINLDGGVDGGHLGILPNDGRIVHPLYITELDQRVVIEEVVQFLRAVDE